jgi:hypothetical protein
LGIIGERVLFLVFKNWSPYHKYQMRKKSIFFGIGEGHIEGRSIPKALFSYLAVLKA